MGLKEGWAGWVGVISKGLLVVCNQLHFDLFTWQMRSCSWSLCHKLSDLSVHHWCVLHESDR